MKLGNPLTARGWGLLASGIAWTLTALLLGQRQLAWPGLFLVAAPVASWLLLLPASISYRVDRRVSAQLVSVGDSVQVELLPAPRSVSFGGVLRLRDRLAPALGEARWQVIPAGVGRWGRGVTYRISPHWRGRHQLGPTEQSLGDGLGLARSLRTAGNQVQLIARPRLEVLPSLRPATGQGALSDPVVRHSGLSGADDVLIREYETGDDVRRIHWRSTAHFGQLMVRREERSWDPRASVILDNRAHGYARRHPDARLEWVISAAASICLQLARDGYAVDLVDADGLRLSGGEPELILEHLTDLEASPTRSLSPALTAADAEGSGQLLVAILGRVDGSDDAELAAALGHGRVGWAILAAGTGSDRASTDRLTAAGWHAVAADPSGSVAPAWQLLGGAHS
jgi:Uncharacterized conserved protein (some members contain a von Willebrand factor type A (vWA) domain)